MRSLLPAGAPDMLYPGCRHTESILYDEKEGKGCRPSQGWPHLPPWLCSDPARGSYQLQTEAPPSRLAFLASVGPERHFCPTPSRISPVWPAYPALPQP
ncbi:hypothetical protein ElyMa_001500500 [Elysia marginata]|uniref:Uncharacterized protein n=1 Tax=Elysia marginata TaxID=1093978 RepID=A0AAV4J5N0_9GAST|nr:hypothetical protein ElyMa_001500500 [Elysia marginata]